MNIFSSQPPAHSFACLSFGIERSIIDFLKEVQNITEKDLRSAIISAVRLAFPEPSALLIRQYQERVSERISQLQENSSKTSKGIKFHHRTIGSNYAEWLAEFDPEQVCLYLADFDPKKAYDYYWKTDLSWIQAAVKLKGEKDSQSLIAAMESVLYGMGGKYSNDTAASGGLSRDFDLSSGEGMDELSKFGFL